MDYYDNSMELRKAINQIRDNYFSPTEHGAFQDIVNSLLYHDRCVRVKPSSSFISFVCSLVRSIVASFVCLFM